MTATAQEYWWVKGVFGDTTPRPEGFRQTAADEFDVIVVGSGLPEAFASPQSKAVASNWRSPADRRSNGSG